MGFEEGFYVKHEHCIANEFPDKKDFSRCESSDAMAIYEHDGSGEEEVWYNSKCYSCGTSFSKEYVHNSSVAKDLGVGDSGVVVERVKMIRKPKAEPINSRKASELIKKYGYKSGGYRSIRDDVCKFFGHLTELDDNGQVKTRWYPETADYKIIGYKPRHHPKGWGGPIGLTGITSDLSGQVKYKDYVGHRNILICGGEEDKAAAFQMLSDYQRKKGQSGYAPPAVVSPTTGEGSAFKQIRANYEFLDQFENIIIGMDNDDAGREATEKIVEVLPAGKVKIAHWTNKDPNQALLDGKEQQWLSDYFQAEPLVRGSVIRSSDLDEELIQELLVEKISLPEYMDELEDAMAGGIPSGVIVNLIGTTKQGKSTNVNEMIYHWIFHLADLMGVMSLELSRGQYAVAMLSRHIGRKLQLFKTPQEALDFINTPEIVAKREELWSDEYGEDRWYLLDEREGNLEVVKRQCEMLFKKYGCKLIVIDPLNDLISSLSNEEQEKFMSWQKSFVKNGVSIINVCHTRKTGAGTSKDNENKNLRELAEDDVQGSSSIPKSAAANVYYHRDMYSDCPIMRNVTWVKAVIRWSGYSGWCGKYYYDPVSHTMYNFDKFFDKHPDKLPEGFDRNGTPFNKSSNKKKSSPKIAIPSKITEADFVSVGGGVKL